MVYIKGLPKTTPTRPQLSSSITIDTTSHNPTTSSSPLPVVTEEQARAFVRAVSSFVLCHPAKVVKSFAFFRSLRTLTLTLNLDILHRSLITPYHHHTTAFGALFLVCRFHASWSSQCFHLQSIPSGTRRHAVSYSHRLHHGQPHQQPEASGHSAQGD